ncbi:MAG: hypothetical protein A2V85_09150 [Chloroflexi bacterium RBG_16_72_14]|nr:MAG: hypothetical protein A2V85_09150 [Chloroflexi bacterium RBG_16_72_14]
MQIVRHGRDLAGRARRRDAIRRRTAAATWAHSSVDRSSPTEIVAHELRTPLTSLLMGGAILVRDDLGAEVRHEIAMDVVTESTRLAGVIEDLLALVADDKRADAPEPLSVPHLLRTEVARAASTAPGVTFRLSAAPDVPVVVSVEPLLVHLVRDLLSIAHAAAAPGGTVELVAGAAGGRLSLRVTGWPRRRIGAPVSHPVLTEAASRVLAARLGAELRFASPPGRVRAMLVLPAGAEAAEPRDR